MAKKTTDPKEIERMKQVDGEIHRLRFPSRGPLDQPLRIILTSGAVLVGQVTGGTEQLYPEDDTHSAYVILTDSEEKSHHIDLLDVESVSLAPDKNMMN